MKVPAAILTAIVLIGSFAACTQLDSRLTEGKKEKYRAACEPIIQWLQTQSASSGLYPEALTQEYQQVLDKLGPPTKYQALNGGKTFSITIGKYSSRHAWTYYYYPHTGWGVDS